MGNMRARKVLKEDQRNTRQGEGGLFQKKVLSGGGGELWPRGRKRGIRPDSEVAAQELKERRSWTNSKKEQRDL